MIHGAVLIGWGFLCLFTAFFTDNTYCFAGVPSHIPHTWGKKYNQKDNKFLNISGGIIFIIVGLLILIS